MFPWPDYGPPGPAKERSGREKYLPLLLLLVLGLTAFAPILPAFFLADDFWIFLTLEQSGPEGVWWSGQGGFFRPLTSLFMGLNLFLHGSGPLGHHLASVGLHVAVAWLVLLLTRRLGGGRGAAYLAGTLFLLHPSRSEPVAWISGQGDLLACLFSLGSLLAFLAGPSRRRTVLSTGLLAAALLAKENALALPFLALALLHIQPKGPVRARALRALVPLLLSVGFYILLRRLALGEFLGGYGPRHLAFDPGRLLRHLWTHTLRSLLPPLPAPFLDLAGVLLVAGLAVLAWRRRRNRLPSGNRVLLCVSLAFVASLAPTLTLGVSKTDSQGERFLYLPSSLLLAGLALALERHLPRAAFRWTGITLCLLAGLLLQPALRTWADAGLLSRNCVQETIDGVQEPMLLLNTPERLKGAYILPGTSLQLALEWLAPHQKPVDLVQVFFHTLSKPKEEIDVTLDGQTYHLTLTARASRFARRAPAPDLRFQVLEYGPDHASVRLPPLVEGRRVYAFRRARPRRLHD